MVPDRFVMQTNKIMCVRNSEIGFLRFLFHNKKKMDAKHPSFSDWLKLIDFIPSKELPANAEFSLIHFIQFRNFSNK